MVSWKQSQGQDADDAFKNPFLLTPSKDPYTRAIQDWMCGQRRMKGFITTTNHSSTLQREPERIQPTRILDAPNLEDDYYQSLLDWSPTNNCIALGLTDQLYLWDASRQVSQMAYRLGGEHLEDDRISAVAWQPGSSVMALGTKTGGLFLIDPSTSSRKGRYGLIRKFPGHSGRIGKGCIERPVWIVDC